jgi:hypothetical protein
MGRRSGADADDVEGGDHGWVMDCLKAMMMGVRLLAIGSAIRNRLVGGGGSRSPARKMASAMMPRSRCRWSAYCGSNTNPALFNPPQIC